MTVFPEIDDATVTRMDIAGPRYTSYPTAVEWRDDFGPRDYAEALARAASDVERPLSLYVHIPFCREMCTYCGCHVIVSQSHDKAERYIDNVERELELVGRHLPGRRGLGRSHWGGGTPTFLDEAQLSRLWRAVTRVFEPRPGAEIAIEIDPAVTSRAQLSLVRRLGFNRISMGAQDFDPEVQEAVCRIQPYEETRALVDFVRDLGFLSVNLDLIYGLPKQTLSSWRRTLDRVVEIRPTRIALFSFAYVPAVKPHQKRLSLEGMPQGASKLALFKAAHDVLTQAGYRWIGMDHFALPEDELAVAQAERRLWRDFQGYTIDRGTDTIAFGVSSISQVGGVFAQNVKTLPTYDKLVGEGTLPVDRGIRLSVEDELRRDVITQLMCNFCLSLDAEQQKHFAPELERLRQMQGEGLVEVQGGTVTVTPLGRVFVRNIAMAFDAYLRADPGKRAFSRTV